MEKKKMIPVEEQCKTCLHFHVCANVLKQQLFIQKTVFNEENPKCKHRIPTVNIARKSDIAEEIIEDFVTELKVIFKEFWGKHDKICTCEFAAIAEAERIIKEKYKEKKDVD